MTDVLHYAILAVAFIAIWAVPLLLWHGFWRLVRKWLGA